MLPKATLLTLENIVSSSNLRYGDLKSHYDPGLSESNLGADVLVTPTSIEQISQIIQ